MNNETKKRFYRAIESKDMEAVIAVLAQEPDLLTCYIGGDTVVHLACECDFPELIGPLTEMGCSVNALNVDGYPPIYLPCSEGIITVVESLLDHGADVDGLRKANAFGQITETTPLVRAIRNGHLELVKMLLSRGASTSVNDGLSLIDRAKGYPEVQELLISAISRHE
jgi:ankyrin repeat protein